MNPHQHQLIIVHTLLLINDKNQSFQTNDQTNHDVDLQQSYSLAMFSYSLNITQLLRELML